jgi:16S rRNA (guanine(966)-N(2))-methyltransferase RsmD
VRIISGIYKGRKIDIPKNLPVRPTTDFARTGLFNILSNRIDFSETKVLDLYAGTGHISYEFISRGTEQITAVDENNKCVKFIDDTFRMLNSHWARATQSDSLTYLKSSKERFDLIFADPPFESSHSDLIPGIVFEKNLLNKKGILILEHSSKKNFETFANFERTVRYGNVFFSFFINSITSAQPNTTY